MQKRIKRIFELVRQTGDRVVVFDGATDDAFVVMDLSSYEELVKSANNSLNPDYSEKNRKQMVDDVQLWQSTQDSVLDEVPTAAKPPVSGAEPEVIVNLSQQQEADPKEIGEKYYFEDVDSEQEESKG